MGAMRRSEKVLPIQAQDPHSSIGRLHLQNGGGLFGWVKWAPHSISGLQSILGVAVAESLDTGCAEDVAAWKRVLRVVPACAKQTELVADKVGWVLHPRRQESGQLATMDKRSNRPSRKVLLSFCADQHFLLCAG